MEDRAIEVILSSGERLIVSARYPLEGSAEALRASREAAQQKLLNALRQSELVVQAQMITLS